MSYETVDGGEFNALNPKGAAPTMMIDAGGDHLFVLIELLAMLVYIAG